MAVNRRPLPSDNFTQISNEWLRDRRMTWQTRGLVGWLASHEIGFRISEARIIAAGPMGRDGVRRMVREAEDLGYLVREQARDASGKHGEVSYILQDPFMKNPQVTPDNGKSVNGSPRENGNPQVTTDDGFSVDGSTVDGKPTPIRRTNNQKTKKQEKTNKPENTTNKDLPLAVGADTVRTARGAATAPAAREDQDFASMAAATFAAIAWRYPDAPPSIRRAMNYLIRRALSVGLPPYAIEHGVREHGNGEDLPQGKQFDHLAAILKRLQADMKAGDLCPECGAEHAAKQGPACSLCRRARPQDIDEDLDEDLAELTEAELAELAAAEAYLTRGAT